MSHKSKKRKQRYYSSLHGYVPIVTPGYPPMAVPRLAVRTTAPDLNLPQPAPAFSEIQRHAELRAARHEELRYRIAPDCKVHIQFDGIATKEAIRKLIHYLEVGIGDFPETADYPSTQN